MGETYEAQLERIQRWTSGNDLSDIMAARKEFHHLTGEFEEGEPWFELRLAMFLDWYHLDRRGPDGWTPAERFLACHRGSLPPDQLLRFELLTVTQRCVLRLLAISGTDLLLDDLGGGGRWLVAWTLPTAGLVPGDILDARIAVVDGRPVTGRGAVLHPRESHAALERIIARARDERMPPRVLVDHLDKMRLKLDRYSNVRTRHVYQYPTDALL
ncbi:MAG TPA: hypothetical protein VM285_16610 [Polyangia bacterium]|nr:hypothetical protein [Polyangia bacterium]